MQCVFLPEFPSFTTGCGPGGGDGIGLFFATRRRFGAFIVGCLLSAVGGRAAA